MADAEGITPGHAEGTVAADAHEGACCGLCTKYTPWHDLYEVDIAQWSACYVCGSCRDAVMSAPPAGEV